MRRVGQQKAGPAPRLLLFEICWYGSLPPVSFHQLPVVAAMHPAMRNPVRARMRRAVPVAGSPDVTAAFPAVIPIYPYIASVRRWPTTLNYWRRWSDANYDLRIRSRRHQSESKQQCQCNFFHDESCPPGILSYRNPACGPARCKSQPHSTGIVAFHDRGRVKIKCRISYGNSQAFDKMPEPAVGWPAILVEKSPI